MLSLSHNDVGYLPDTTNGDITPTPSAQVSKVKNSVIK